MGKGLTAARKPYTHGGDRIIVAVEDELFDQPETVEKIRSIVDRLAHGGPSAEVLPASAFADPDTEADFWLGAPPEPSEPGRKVLWMTEAREVYEQDERRIVYMKAPNGEWSEVWPLPPAAFGNPRTMRSGRGSLETFNEAAMFFMAPTDDGRTFRVRIRAMGVLFNLLQEPATTDVSIPAEFDDWLQRARAVLEPLPRGLAGLKRRWER
jgi:hypothetical protein